MENFKQAQRQETDNCRISHFVILLILSSWKCSYKLTLKSIGLIRFFLFVCISLFVFARILHRHLLGSYQEAHNS